MTHLLHRPPLLLMLLQAFYSGECFKNTDHSLKMHIPRELSRVHTLAISTFITQMVQLRLF